MTDGRGRRAGAVLAIGTLLTAVVATQWPFEYRFTRFAVWNRWRKIDWSWMPKDHWGHVRLDQDLVLNLLMLIPLGVGYGLWRRTTGWRLVVEALVVGTISSAALEAAQMVTRERITSFADVWRNAVGCAVGGAIALAIRNRLDASAAALHRPPS